jgi:hypothetical protein
MSGESASNGPAALPGQAQMSPGMTALPPTRLRWRILTSSFSSSALSTAAEAVQRDTGDSENSGPRGRPRTRTRGLGPTERPNKSITPSADGIPAPSWGSVQSSAALLFDRIRAPLNGSPTTDCLVAEGSLVDPTGSSVVFERSRAARPKTHSRG